MRLRRLLHGLGYASLLFVLLQAGNWAYWRLTGNIHTVVTEEFYRSGQLSPDRLSRLVQEHSIGSVINLRGDSTGTAWYDRERAAAKTLGVAYYDFDMSPKRILPPEQVAEILEILRTAPKPVLVHCREGADRTGLVSALYMAKIKNVSIDEADQQLSWRYGHFPWLNSETEEMDDTYWREMDPQGDHESMWSWR